MTVQVAEEKNRLYLVNVVISDVLLGTNHSGWGTYSFHLLLSEKLAHILLLMQLLLKQRRRLHAQLLQHMQLLFADITFLCLYHQTVVS